MAPEERDALDAQALLFQLLEDCDGRPTEERLAALCRAAPEHADEVRRLYAELRETGLVDDEADSLELGGFRLVRRLGAGGMGVVHLAEEVALKRLVALKVVRPEQVYFESARQRFRREVESTARLSHPGIAAVYSFGEERGVPYFAQEYVAGAALDAVLRALDDREPARLSGRDLARAVQRALGAQDRDAAGSGTFFAGAWPEAAARVGLAAAEALHHAHERGVLHRDVKPSNLLLTPAGRVVLVDFGLATIVDSAPLTRTGALLGSLPYMAPEVLDGGEASVASDVYSLGVTLYELVGLSLPFASNRVEELRRLVLEGAPLRPRQRNPDLPRDLETIILCALDRTPGRRYADAAALADDLRAFLDQRPIGARPAGPVTKLARLVARRPAAFTAAALTTLLVVGAPVAYGVVQARHVREVERLNEDLAGALSGERAATASAEASYAAAVRTVEHLMEQFSDRALTRYPALARVRLDAIDRAVATFEELRALRPHDTLLALQTALAHRARGDALYDLRRLDESLAAQRVQLDLVEAERARHPDSPIVEHELAIAQSRVARTLSQLRRPAEAVPAVEAGIAAARRALALEPERFETELVLASLQNAYGMNLGEAERPAEARAAFEAAVAAAERLVAARPDEPRTHEVLARALRHCYGALVGELQAPERLPSLRRAREEYERALALLPGDRGLREDLVALDYDLAGAFVARGDLVGARGVLERSSADAAALAAQYPEVTLYTTARLEAAGLLAHVSRLQGEWPAARAAMRAVAELGEELSREREADPGLAVQSVIHWTNLANFLANSPDLGPERYVEALELIAHARALLARLEGPARSGPDGRGVAFQVDYNTVLATAALDRAEEAEATVRAMQLPLVGDPFDVRILADAWCEVRNALERVGADPARTRAAGEEALRWLEAAVDAGYRDRAELESTPALAPLRGDARFRALLERLPAEGR